MRASSIRQTRTLVPVCPIIVLQPSIRFRSKNKQVSMTQISPPAVFAHESAASRPSFCEPAQGMALPPQISTPPSATLAAASAHRSAHVVKHGHDDVQSLDRGSNPRNAHGIRLRPVSELRKSRWPCSYPSGVYALPADACMHPLLQFPFQLTSIAGCSSSASSMPCSPNVSIPYVLVI